MRPEHVQQPVQRQLYHHKHVVQMEAHAPMEPPNQEVPIKSNVPDEALDQMRYPPTPKDQIQRELGVPEPFEQNSKSVVLEPKQCCIMLFWYKGKIQ